MRVVWSVLLGPAKSGKTVFCQRLEEKVVDAETKYVSTVGADFLIYRRGKDEILKIWDTTGQECYRTCLPLYLNDLNDSSIVFVFCDATPGAGDLDEIKSSFRLEKLRVQAPKAKFVLVVSKLAEGAVIPAELKTYAKEERYDAVCSVDAFAKNSAAQCANVLEVGLRLLPAAVAAAAPAPSTKENLRRLVEAYQRERSADLREYYSWGGVGRFFGEVSKAEKLRAAAQLLLVIDEKAEYSTLNVYKARGFARGSKLGKLYSQYSSIRSHFTESPVASPGKIL